LDGGLPTIQSGVQPPHSKKSSHNPVQVLSGGSP
jgi:hypothetical protein